MEWFIVWLMKKKNIMNANTRSVLSVLRTQLRLIIIINNFSCGWIRTKAVPVFTVHCSPFNAEFNWFFFSMILWTTMVSYIFEERRQNLPPRTIYWIGSINANLCFYSIQNWMSHEMRLKASSDPIEAFAYLRLTTRSLYSYAGVTVHTHR